MKKNKHVAIIHFNTPELTEAAILSLRLHGGLDYAVTVFDNSDKRPFKVKMPGVTVIDNTKGQCLDFEKELAKCPNRSYDMGVVFGGVYGSAKHMMSVQWLMDNVLTDDFILFDGDILIQKPIDVMWVRDHCAAGFVQSWRTSNNPFQIDRYLPMLLYINSAKCKATGVRFYDSERCYALQEGGKDNRNNWYDTGGSFLEDIIKNKPASNGLKFSREIYTSLFIHYQKASWYKADKHGHMAWLNQHRKLWEPSPGYPLGAVEGTIKQLKIYICTHKDFVQRVKHAAYEVMDARDFDGDVAPNGLGGLFYSEVLTYWRLSKKKTLPKWIGFCGWRKYWDFLSNVPDIQEPIVCRLHDVGCSVREHYVKFANPKDLELATAIIDEQFPDFSPAWHQQLDSHTLHPFNMFIIPSKDFRRMMKLVWAVLDEFVKRAGDIDARIDADPEGYHVARLGRKYAYRIGGQIAERMISAWMDWQFPQAKQVPVKVTDSANWTR